VGNETVRWMQHTGPERGVCHPHGDVFANRNTAKFTEIPTMFEVVRSPCIVLW
jgi:hypothetical protein